MRRNKLIDSPTSTSVDYDKYYELLDTDIDFDFYLPYSLGCSNLLHEKIIKEYSNNKEKYFTAYKNSPYYKDSRLTSLSASNQLAVQYLIGILSCMTLKEKEDYLISLIKISFKFVYQYVNKNSIVDIYYVRDLSLNYAKKNKLSIIYGSIHIFSITLYLSKYFNKQILLENDQFTVKLLRESYKSSNRLYSFDLIENDFTNEIINFKKKYNDFPIKKFNKLSLNHFITDLNNCYRNDLLKKQINIDENELNNSVLSTDFNKGLSIIATFLGLSEIDWLDLQNITSINNEDVDKILNYTFTMLEENEQDMNLSPNFLFGLLLILDSIVRDYQKVKNLLLDTSIEESLAELSNLKINYQNKISKLETIETQLSKENISLKNKSETLENEVIKLQKENKILLDKIKILETKNSTLNNTIDEYKLINDKILIKTNENTLDLDKIVDFLSQKKLLLIGGNPNWYSSLAKVLPNLKYLNPSQLNKDLNHISNFDAIFFHYTFNNHSMFDKVQKIVKTKGTPLHYCGEHSNLKINLINFYLSFKNDF